MEKLGLHLLQPRLGFLALGQIADETCEIALFAGMHLAHRKLHGKGGAVAALPGYDRGRCR